MTIYQETIQILERDSRIKSLFQKISPGDRSILELMLDREESAGLTTEGSPNDQLWSCLADYHWMAVLDAIPALPTDTRRYSLTEAGRRAIPVVLARLR
ncbi:hypothetical protein [Sphingomonas lycopersici]|uniref:Uncharacterized protein n=1 Tax=Sphingomonas lycopersici TaxID=2951807 RepID=A0AA41Z7D4_9SPHN|nr:hypothetical protein [Sphingomonas lycopersici]MCW6534293.1 hypothetical protein [Sphingomonas lycopersici]